MLEKIGGFCGTVRYKSRAALDQLWFLGKR